MNRCHNWYSIRSQAKAWLAGMLVVLLLVLVFESVAHRARAGVVAHHQCAVCLLAHGGVIADGCIRALAQVSAPQIKLSSPWAVAVRDSADLRLSPGRAPPA